MLTGMVVADWRFFKIQARVFCLNEQCLCETISDTNVTVKIKSV